LLHLLTAAHGPLTAAPVGDCRGRFRGQSGHGRHYSSRQLLTDTVEKGKNEAIEIFACALVETDSS
jgi:hypothetical protein